MNNNYMYEYMAEVDLPLPFDNELISLIPEQRAYINRLMQEKIITSYAVSVEDGKLWTTLLAESIEQADDVISGFPIFHLVDYRLYKLAFHSNTEVVLPKFSLN